MARHPAITLTERDRDIMGLIARGHTNGEIAERLGISFATAKWHVSEVISKLGVSSREEVAEYWRREQSLSRRFARAFAAASLPLAAKLAIGGVVAAGVAIGAVVALDIALSSQARRRRPQRPIATRARQPVHSTVFRG
jgi:DNA-binding CsgD family transcriptional regulator